MGSDAGRIGCKADGVSRGGVAEDRGKACGEGIRAARLLCV
jgi:hypothetical protein